MSTIFTVLTLTATVLATVILNDFVMAPSAGGMQTIPQATKTPSKFSNGHDPLLSEPPDTRCQVPDVYVARKICIPIGRYMHGNLNFFPTMDDPSKDTSVWGSDHGNGEQTACAISANAYFISNVAMHPYWLKYAALDRKLSFYPFRVYSYLLMFPGHCMQDICIWFWKEDGSSDMQLKVTDICTPDSADGVPCMDPIGIKIDHTKAGIIVNKLKPVPPKNQYLDKVWPFFTKCSSYVSSSIGPFYLLLAFLVPLHTERNERELAKLVTGLRATCLSKQ
jgi:hypothetical protein